MSDQKHEPGSPGEWLSYAKSDLALARMADSPDIMLKMLCFHAQQAAEKSLKAVLLSRNVEFPNTHNLRVLLDRIPPETEITTDVEDAALLTDYAVSARYPGHLEDITQEDYLEALRLALVVLDWAEITVEAL
uniref:HEPN domain-containing protein n=1 Tax=Candidatus Kentrum sp. DK TaxID=2126562 RepID=A0A450RYM8_9GAMM|nr:MAG: HEPN domain-containing protein [Candidatus Kentron sp. DK]